MRAIPDRLSRRLGRLRGEDGFTLIEVLVAIVVLIIGMFGAVTTFDHSRKATSSGERLETMAHIAQNALETMSATSYDSIGYANGQTLPQNSGSGLSTDPLNFVKTSNTQYQYDWTDSTKLETFVQCTASQTGCLTTSPTNTWRTSWNDGRRSGEIFRFVTWVNDNCTGCANNQDYKRLTVVVTNSGHTPLINSTVMRNPS
jgi:prepilin-type N-terminal cleavage/methylation domain-containing protein